MKSKLPLEDKEAPLDEERRRKYNGDITGYRFGFSKNFLRDFF